MCSEILMELGRRGRDRATKSSYMIILRYSLVLHSPIPITHISLDLHFNQVLHHESYHRVRSQLKLWKYDEEVPERKWKSVTVIPTKTMSDFCCLTSTFLKDAENREQGH
ncbi:hypothetical protein RB195_016562 [Necator americanus]|uniref:Uncharacterized protein n=1 Tax=Necator americanus TaxID=51031 RepID=A0ABR1C116_NECAM